MSGIVLNVPFDLQTAQPLDNRYVVADIAARDAFPFPYVGLKTYVVADSTSYVCVSLSPLTWEEDGGSGAVPATIDGSTLVGNSVSEVFEETTSIINQLGNTVVAGAPQFGIFAPFVNTYDYGIKGNHIRTVSNFSIVSVKDLVRFDSNQLYSKQIELTEALSDYDIATRINYSTNFINNGIVETDQTGTSKLSSLTDISLNPGEVLLNGTLNEIDKITGNLISTLQTNIDVTHNQIELYSKRTILNPASTNIVIRPDDIDIVSPFINIESDVEITNLDVTDVLKAPRRSLSNVVSEQPSDIYYDDTNGYYYGVVNSLPSGTERRALSNVIKSIQPTTTTVEINLDEANIWEIDLSSLTGSFTFTYTGNPKTFSHYSFNFVQGATGRAITFAADKFAYSAVPPIFPTNANEIIFIAGQVFEHPVKGTLLLLSELNNIITS